MLGWTVYYIPCYKQVNLKKNALIRILVRCYFFLTVFAESMGRSALVTWSLGTERGLMRDLTIGGTAEGPGRTGLEAQKAAVESWVTRE